ncbi:MAG: acyltransferase [Bacteroidales bacterium]|nr:acyltransferase [Bacteroidales bacterium]
MTSYSTRNLALDWLKGLMILCVVFYHSYLFPIFRGYLAVEVFFFISGYFMMLSFLRNPTTAVKYTWGRIKRVATPFFLGLTANCLLRNHILSNSDSFSSFVDRVGNVFSSFMFAEELVPEVFRSVLINGGWFFSVLIISSFILYGMLQFNERLATTILFPLIILFGYNALMGHSDTICSFERIGLLGAPLTRGLYEMAAGAFICHVYWGHKDSIDKRSILINILGLVSFVIFLAMMFTKHSMDKYCIITVPWFLTASVIDSSWLNRALQRINGGIIARVGRYTIYILCIHGLAEQLVFACNDHILHHALNGASLLITYLIAATIASFVLYYSCQLVNRLLLSSHNNTSNSSSDNPESRDIFSSKTS